MSLTPAYYFPGPHEVIKVIDAMNLGFRTASALTYLVRLGIKGACGAPLPWWGPEAGSDLQKAIRFLALAVIEAEDPAFRPEKVLRILPPANRIAVLNAWTAVPRWPNADRAIARILEGAPTSALLELVGASAIDFVVAHHRSAGTLFPEQAQRVQFAAATTAKAWADGIRRAEQLEKARADCLPESLLELAQRLDALGIRPPDGLTRTDPEGWLDGKDGRPMPDPRHQLVLEAIVGELALSPAAFNGGRVTISIEPEIRDLDVMPGLEVTIAVPPTGPVIFRGSASDPRIRAVEAALAALDWHNRIESS
jgi:hypothetical protein